MHVEQVLISYVGYLPSSYYLVLGKKSVSGFQSTTLQAIALILAIAFVSDFMHVVFNLKILSICFFKR